MVVSFGIFLKPVSHELGWERETLASALFLATTLNALATPLFGRLIDRWGVRAVTLPAIALFSVCTALNSELTGSRVVLTALFGLWGISSAGHGQLPYATAISRTFSANRGMALSLGLIGLGIGTALIPRLCALFIDEFGWRRAYIALGCTTFLVAFTAVLLWLRPGNNSSRSPRDSRKDQPDRQAADSRRAEAPTLLQVMKTSWRFWAIVLSVFLFALAVNGLTAHAVPLMTDRGFSTADAAAKMGVVGAAAIGGRVLSGYLVDHLYPPWVAAAFFGLPCLGAWGLHSGRPDLLIPALTVIGASVGAESSLAGVLVSRYLGLARFGEIFGYVALAFSLGVGLGPWLLSVLYDHSHSYNSGLVVAASCVLLAAILVGSLGSSPPAFATESMQ